MAAAGYQPRRDLLGAAGKPPVGYSARLVGRFHLDMVNPPRPRQGGKIDKGSPAIARSGVAERIEPPFGAAAGPAAFIN
jgi:hypothetical protein